MREELESNCQIDNCSELHTKDGRTIPRTNGRKPEPKTHHSN